MRKLSGVLKYSDIVFLVQTDQPRFLPPISIWVRDGMAATVVLDNRQNHQTMNADALSFRKPDEAVQEQFCKYFEDGMTAAVAADFHTSKLELDPELNPALTAVNRADAAVNAKRSTVSYWYARWREVNLGKRHGEAMWSALER